MAGDKGLPRSPCAWLVAEPARWPRGMSTGYHVGRSHGDAERRL
jgi:hypothetical protein